WRSGEGSGDDSEMMEAVVKVTMVLWWWRGGVGGFEVVTAVGGWRWCGGRWSGVGDGIMMVEMGVVVRGSDGDGG
ncbi:hypothetical protein Tco_0946417, partial [Tanacetum coccineum]